MYTVVVLVEDELVIDDARKVTALHEELTEMGEAVTYHVLLPATDVVESEAMISSLGGADMHGLGPVGATDDDPGRLATEQDAIDHDARDRLDAAVSALRSLGAEAAGSLTHEDPIRGLVSVVTELEAREVIILTEPHVVAEFFHTDWTHQARRHLNVPVLHLIERSGRTEADPDVPEDAYADDDD